MANSRNRKNAVVIGRERKALSLREELRLAREDDTGALITYLMDLHALNKAGEVRSAFTEGQYSDLIERIKYPLDEDDLEAALEVNRVTLSLAITG